MTAVHVERPTLPVHRPRTTPACPVVAPGSKAAGFAPSPRVLVIAGEGAAGEVCPPINLASLTIPEHASVSWARSGQHAYALLSAFEYDLIVADPAALCSSAAGLATMRLLASRTQPTVWLRRC